MVATSQMLIRETQIDLNPFSSSEISTAKQQWTACLHQALATLAQASVDIPLEDFNYSGAGGMCAELQSLELAVDEARRMVCILSDENHRRRSEGDIMPRPSRDIEEEAGKREREVVVGPGGEPIMLRMKST